MPGGYDDKMRDGPISIEVRTPQGVFLRWVMPATLLPEGVERGPAAEVATRGAAAHWGLPDFVFHPAQERRGTRRREIGDAIIVAGQLGASVQVKARQTPGDDADRERSWLMRKAEEGTRQATGTIRRLRYPGPTRLENLRGHTVRLHGRAIEWVPVVVLDHPGLGEDLVIGGEAVVLLRRDWEFLFEQLKSTVAVVEYLHRVAPMDPVALGMESLRYYEIANADANATPTPMDPAFAVLAMRSASVPFLPLQPAEYGTIIRSILEDIASVPIDGFDEAGASYRLQMLAAIDSAPIATRREMGETIMEWLEQVQQAPAPQVWWRFRHYVWFDRVHLILAVTNVNAPEMREAFGYLVQLRHVERLELAPSQIVTMTVGVLLQPRHDGVLPWDTTAAMTEGEIRLDPEFRAAAERIWKPIQEAILRDDVTDPIEAFRREAEELGSA